MNQVEIFTNIDPDQVEAQVNEFLEKMREQSILVVDIKYSVGAVYSALVWYDIPRKK